MSERPLKDAVAGERYLVYGRSPQPSLAAIIDVDGEPWVAMDHCLYGPVTEFPHDPDSWWGFAYEKVEPE